MPLGCPHPAASPAEGGVRQGRAVPGRLVPWKRGANTKTAAHAAAGVPGPIARGWDLSPPRNPFGHPRGHGVACTRVCKRAPPAGCAHGCTRAAASLERAGGGARVWGDPLTHTPQNRFLQLLLPPPRGWAEPSAAWCDTGTANGTASAAANPSLRLAPAPPRPLPAPPPPSSLGLRCPLCGTGAVCPTPPAGSGVAARAAEG